MTTVLFREAWGSLCCMWFSYIKSSALQYIQYLAAIITMVCYDDQRTLLTPLFLQSCHFQSYWSPAKGKFIINPNCNLLAFAFIVSLNPPWVYIWLFIPQVSVRWWGWNTSVEICEFRMRFTKIKLNVLIPWWNPALWWMLPCSVHNSASPPHICSVVSL